MTTLLEVLAAAQFCAATYATSAPDWQALGFDKGRVITADDQMALIGVVGKDATVVVRGSDNMPNWLEDFDAVTVPSPWGGYVHKGFWLAREKLVVPLMDGLNDLHAFVMKTEGHSLGAAIATLLAKTWGVRSITFGSPRVGNAEWADSFGLPQVRCVHDDDLAPRVPVWAPLPPLDYRHIGTQWWLDRLGKLEVGPASLAEDIEFICTPAWDQCRQHKITEYIAALTGASMADTAPLVRPDAQATI